MTTVSDIVAALDQLEPSFADISVLMAALTTRMAQLASASAGRSGVADNSDDDLLDADAAAKLLGVSPSWLYHRPKLPFRVKIGGKLKFSRSQIECWIERRQRV